MRSRRNRRKGMKLTFFAKTMVYFAMVSAVLGFICCKLEWWGIALAFFCVNNTYFCGYLLTRTNWIRED